MERWPLCFDGPFVIACSFHINISPLHESFIPSLFFVSSVAYQYLQFAYLLLIGGWVVQRDRNDAMDSP